MNECNEKFLKENGIIIEDVCSSIDCHIYSSMEENHIIAQYGFHTNSQRELISVADIVGYDTSYRGGNTNIFLSMDQFFDDKGSVYSTRSVGMLDYNKDNIIDNLKQSFEEQPISLIETGEGKYTVLDNGLHRYTLLRILYLSEAAKANGNKEQLADLAKKYTIPAAVTEIDLDKTYCKYLLNKVKTDDKEWNVVDISTEYDSNNKPTGKAIVEYGNGETESLTNEDLLALTKERVYEDESFKDNYSVIQHDYDKYPSFAMFMEEEFSDIITLEKTDLTKEGIIKNG